MVSLSIGSTVGAGRLSMHVGDIVKHKYGTLQGFGVVLDVRYHFIRALWTAHGQTVVHERIAHRFLEVVNASR